MTSIKSLFSFFLIVFYSIIWNACSSTQKISDPYQHITDQQVVAILKKSFKAMGGLKNWQQIKTLKYNKNSTLLLESGAVEKESYQSHHYSYKPIPSYQINWLAKDGKKHQIIEQNGQIEKQINGQIDAQAKESTLRTSLTTALFVIGIPFKMIDKGVALSYEGTDVLEDGQKVEVIKAVYNPKSNAHHTTEDIWWYYFDQKDYRLTAYVVKHLDHISYVKNLEFARSIPFLFPTKRISYRVNSDRKILYTRAKYLYENWEVW